MAFISTFTGTSLSQSTFHNSQLPKTSAPARRITTPCMSRVLIINTKGGGHGFIGLHLSRLLLSQSHQVDLFQVGEPSSSIAPFSSYSKLESEYPSTFTLSHGDPTTYSFSSNYDAVYDNNSKSTSDITPLLPLVKSSTEWFYISSAGSYIYDINTSPHLESQSAKGGVIDVENLLNQDQLSSIHFRPIYIIGRESCKREYTDYFFDRILRDQPILLPSTGTEMTSLTDVRDVVNMLAKALGKGYKGEVINLANTRCITLNGMIQMCAQVVGKQPKIINYDHKKAENVLDGFKVKKAFPFRPRHFWADPGKAERMLGWEAEYSGSKEGLMDTIKDCYKEYLELGLDKKDVDFSLDQKLLASVV